MSYQPKMKDKLLNHKEREIAFNKFIVSEYLKYGSVDSVFIKNNYDIPVSYPQVHRIIKNWGIVKSAGPNSTFSEALCYLALFSGYNLSPESVYRKFPPSFQTSLSTMYRILHHVKEGLIRRVGTALILTPYKSPEQILVGDDVSTPRLELGKPFGSVSFPMGYSKEGEDTKDSILRVLQREAFTKEAIDQKLSTKFIPKNAQPFMFLDVADVRVAVYHLELPEALSDRKSLSSFKLKNFRFTSLDSLINPNGNKDHFRTGIREMAVGYYKHLAINEDGAVRPAILKSFVNTNLYKEAAFTSEE
jgi:hypothetical protein